ncbi:MAG: FABP family protein [Rhodoluna sp.]|nr:FABP family protein [Rhodoluna sp.]MBP6186367.1 FABP family protein [Rhodoluna sp.]
MFVLPEDLPLELTPFAFLVGKWEGTGVISYKADGDESDATEHEFKQRIEFAHDGQNVLTYISTAQIMDASGTNLPSEIGYWRIARAAEPADHGPGLLIGQGELSLKSHEDLEKLRNAEGGFDIQVSTLQPGGFAELYNGKIKGARIDLASYAGTAFEGAKVYRHSTRMFGLVENALLWVWEIAMPGSELKPHASARLERVE